MNRKFLKILPSKKASVIGIIGSALIIISLIILIDENVNEYSTDIKSFLLSIMLFCLPISAISVTHIVFCSKALKGRKHGLPIPVMTGLFAIFWLYGTIQGVITEIQFYIENPILYLDTMDTSYSTQIFMLAGGVLVAVNVALFFIKYNKEKKITDKARKG